MESKWLQDFLSLAETGSFSCSAELRYVTQSTLSRRIRALETWIGCELVDRTLYPVRLTPAGETFKAQAMAILARISGARALIRGNSASETIGFALPHALSLTLFPQWLAEIERGVGKLSCKLVAGNVEDAMRALVQGRCDLFMCYHLSQHPIGLDTDRFQMMTIGSEPIRPYARVRRGQEPEFRLPGRPDAPLPFLAYAPGAYLRRIVDRILERAPCFLTQRYEADMAEGLKEMALEGHGVAFLPQSVVRRELRKRQLATAGDERWSLDLEIRLYRDRRNTRPVVERVWRHLQQRYAAAAAGD